MTVAEPAIRRAPIRAGWSPLDGTGQAAVLAEDDGIDFAVTGIGGGKSEVAAFKLLRWMIRYPRRPNGSPCRYLIIGKDTDNVLEVQILEKLVGRIIQSIPDGERRLIRRIVGGQRPRIELKNGVIAVGKSGLATDSVRNYEADGVWIDEAAYVPEETFAVALSRQRSAQAIRMIVTSSPRVGWLSKVYQGIVGRKDGNPYVDLADACRVKFHRWDSRANTENRGEVLDAVEAALNAVRGDFAAQELDGLFVGIETERETFPGYDAQLGGHRVLTSAEAVPVVMGVDLGQENDYTWLTIMGATGVALWQDRFKASSPRPVGTQPWNRNFFYPQVADHLLDVCKRWGVRRVCVDEAMHGKAFAQQLRVNPRARAMKLRIDGVRTDSPGKRDEILENLSQACAHKRWLVPSSWEAPGRARVDVAYVDELRREIEEITTEEKGAGKRRFCHPAGGHDDGLVSNALAWQAIDGNRPPARRTDLEPFLRPQATTRAAQGARPARNVRVRRPR